MFQYKHFVTDVCGVTIKCACDISYAYLRCPRPPRNKRSTCTYSVTLLWRSTALDPIVRLYRYNSSILYRPAEGPRASDRPTLLMTHTHHRIYISFITPAYFYCIFRQQTPFRPLATPWWSRTRIL